MNLANNSDRDAAIRCCEHALRNIHPDEAENIDFPAMAEAFARHRIDGQEEMRAEVVRECAEVANRAYRSYSEPTDWDYGAQDACTKIEREILAALHAPEEKDNG